MPRSLTPNSNLEALRREAKRWLKSIAAGDIEAAARFHAAFPDHAAAPKLREVQQALAREHGFPSWAALKQELDDRARTHERVRELLAEEPDRANREDRPGEPALFCLPNDEEKALAIAELLLTSGADPNFRNPLGQTPADAARRRGLDDVAALIEDAQT